MAKDRSRVDTMAILEPIIMSSTSTHPRRGLFRNVALLLSSDVSAQLIGLLSLPVVTRLFSPADLGVMTLIWAYVMSLSVIAAFRYESTIVIEKDEENARGLLGLCAIINFLFFCTVVVAGLIFFQQVLKYLNLAADNSALFWFVPTGILVVGLNNSVMAWVTRNQLFGLVSVSKVASGLTTAAIKVGFGLAGYATTFVLLIGNLAGVLIPLLILIFTLWESAKRVTTLPSPRTMLSNAVKYKDFPSYHSLATITHSVSYYIPMFMFGALYSKEVVGFYGLAIATLGRPLMMISDSLAKVLLQRVTQLDGGSLLIEFRRITTALVVIGLLPMSLVMVAGPELFGWFFGQEWSYAGQMSQVLAPWFLAGFSNTPATQAFIAKQHLRFLFLFNLIYAISRVMVVGICVRQALDPLLTVMYFSVTGVLFQIFYIAHADKVIRLDSRQPR